MCFGRQTRGGYYRGQKKCIRDILAHEYSFVPGPKEMYFLYRQHCFFHPLPPNLRMSLHASHEPQPSSVHPEHLLHLFLLFRTCVLIVILLSKFLHLSVIEWRTCTCTMYKREVTRPCNTRGWCMYYLLIVSPLIMVCAHTFIYVLSLSTSCA